MSNSRKELLSYDDVAALIVALTDPEEVIRIGAMRALLRLPLSEGATARVIGELDRYERADVLDAAYRPGEDARKRIFEIVHSSDEEDVSLAHSVVRKMAQEMVTGGQESREFEGDSPPQPLILTLLCKPVDVYIDPLRDVPEDILLAAPAEMSSCLITSLFARLATPAYDAEPGDNRLWLAESVGKLVQKLGDRFKPDIAELFAVYQVFLRRSTYFWIPWVQENSLAGALPSDFPLHEFPLGTTRLIEWTTSRRGPRETVLALQDAVRSPQPRRRWAAVQLIESAARYADQSEAPRFGGGSGPPDILSQALWNYDYNAGLRHRITVGETLKLNNTPDAQTNDAGPSDHVINFWLGERPAGDLRPLQIGEQYTGYFQVGKEVAASLIDGPDKFIPGADIPRSGLETNWVVIARGFEIGALTPQVVITDGDEIKIVRFTLLIPTEGDSSLVQLLLRPVTPNATLTACLFVDAALYRELRVSFEVEREGATDAGPGPFDVQETQHASAANVNLPTVHAWPGPPGVITIVVTSPNLSTVTGNFGSIPREGDVTRINTQAASIRGIMKNVREAADAFRTTFTSQLNDIDPDDLKQRLGRVPRPRRLEDDRSKNDQWGQIAASAELQTLARQGKELYDEIFSPGTDLRMWLDSAERGARINVSWRKSALTEWVPHIPWSLLYCDEVSADKPADPLKFWGLRYRIGYAAHPPAAISKLESLGGLDDAWSSSVLYYGDGKNDAAAAEAKVQRRLWPHVHHQTILPATADADAVDAANARQAVFQELSKPSNDQTAVLYFFCQCRPGQGNRPLLQFGSQGSAADEIDVIDLGNQILAGHPLVFANACATTGTDHNFVNEMERLFFKRSCRAYIGTECRVPVPLASRFATIFFRFFYRLMDPAPISGGEAMYQTRLFLWTQYRNLGGLFYTYINQYDLYMASDAELDEMRKL